MSLARLSNPLSSGVFLTSSILAFSFSYTSLGVSHGVKTTLMTVSGEVAVISFLTVRLTSMFSSRA